MQVDRTAVGTGKPGMDSPKQEIKRRNSREEEHGRGESAGSCKQRVWMKLERESTLEKRWRPGGGFCRAVAVPGGHRGFYRACRIREYTLKRIHTEENTY